jgi:4-hydroxybenzoate polyprenyltransferase
VDRLLWYNSSMERLRLFIKNTPISLGTWLISFVGIILIRIFFEQFSNGDKLRFALIDLPTIIHYCVFYLATILALMIILLFFGRINLKEVATLCIFGFFVVWVPPIIDLLTAGPGGHVMTYLFLPWKELFLRFITFFGGHISSGITLGIQIELMFGIIFCYTYVKTTTKNNVRAIISAITFYAVIFILLATPSIISLFLLDNINIQQSFLQSIASSNIISNNIHPQFYGNTLSLLDLGFNKTMTGIFTIIALIFGTLLFYLAEQKKFFAVIKNSRPERIFHFILLIIFGWVLSGRGFINWIDVMGLLLAIIAFTCAWLFSVCQNDIYDEKIDIISNPDRPFISNALSRNDMDAISKIFLLFAILSAYASSHYTLFFVCFYLFVYYIYSNPPLRLKRYVMLNSFLVSLACLSTILGGFFIVSNNKLIITFPFNLVLAIILFFTTVSNIRDIKDIDGDRADGIKTLPVLLGEKKSKKIIAGMICFFFLIIPWYFNISFLLIPSIIASVLSWYFINKKNYVEWKSFVVYMAYLILIILAFLFKL